MKSRHNWLLGVFFDNNYMDSNHLIHGADPNTKEKKRQGERNRTMQRRQGWQRS